MWGALAGVTPGYISGPGNFGGHVAQPVQRQPAVYAPVAPAALQTPAPGGFVNNALAFPLGKFQFFAAPQGAEVMQVGPQHGMSLAPPVANAPLVAAGEAWGATIESGVPGTLASDMSDESGDERTDGELLKSLVRALRSRNVEKLKDALDWAATQGFHGPEVRQARDMLLELEADMHREEAGRVVDEAIESDNWWKLQEHYKLPMGRICQRPK
jgi:hypothetical protein